MSMPTSDPIRPVIAQWQTVGLCCLPALMLMSCGKQGGDGDTVTRHDGNAIECAIGQDAAWTRACRVERNKDATGVVLTLRHADGGFRRLRIVDDGRGVVPADGAEQVGMKVIGDRRIELSLGQDRYRLPATVGAPAN